MRHGTGTAPRPELPSGGGTAAGALRTRALVARARKGDRQAREALIAAHLPLARALARRYRRGAEPLDDLVQVASLGLIKAVDRFDPERGHSFSTFAQPTIVGELLRHFRDTGWGIHVARGTQELALRVRAAAEAVEAETGRAPTPRQLAARTGASLEAVVEALGALANRTALSLAAPTGGHDDDGGAEMTIADTLGRADGGYERAEARALLGSAVRCLPERERKILRLRFVQDMTQSEIAAEIGVSQMQISRLLRQSLERLAQITRARS